MSERATPIFGLVGLGRFGYEHYKELCRLEESGRLILKAVYSETGQTHKNVRHPVLPIKELSDVEAGMLDALIIASPASSHFELIKKYHNACHILVEKPLANTPALAKKCIELQAKGSKLIVPAHNYRFHPAVTYAKSVIDQISTGAVSIDAVFVNPIDRDNGGDPAQEMLHALDIVQHLVGESISASHRHDLGRCAFVDCEYENFIGRYQLGFGKTQARLITIRFASHTLKLDFIENVVTVEDLRKDLLTKEVFGDTPVSLQEQLTAFCDTITGGPTPAAFASIVDACETLVATRLDLPISGLRIAVIGGGVFGCQCGIELSALGHVDVFERQSDILTEASLKNQWRHHSGFHYPLSFETVKEIESCKEIFEEQYQDAVVRSVPSYYMVASTAREIPAERYLASCNYHNLNFSIVPELSIIKPGSVSVTLLTDEALYDIPTLRELMRRRLKDSGAKLYLNTHVMGGNTIHGKKTLSLNEDGVHRNEVYDVVVNCAYSEFGDMASMFKVENKKIRLEYVEMLELKVDIDPICLTFIDAPFLSLTHMLDGNRFFLSHRDHSVIERSYEERIEFGGRDNCTSNKRNIIRDACQYMPFLKDAEFVKSWYCIKARSAYEKEFWEVPTIVKNHGFGYWSVLGGKVLTSTKNAKDLAQEVREHFSISSPSG